VSGAQFVPDLSLWDAWDPAEAARRLAGVDSVWYVTAGWALDLFVGHQTRQHEDLEIAVPEAQFKALSRALPELEFFVVGGGVAQPVTDDALSAHRQTWGRDTASGEWRLDVFREPWDGDTWVYRRDRRIRVPRQRATAHSPDGIPYAQPEIVLLFKSKDVRPKDQDDFDVVLPLLDAQRRRWLADAVRLLDPTHRWLPALNP
jgi:hypothetical protein